MTATHSLPEPEFAALAATGGGPAAIAALRSGQLSKNTLLIRAIAAAARQSCPGLYAESGFDDAYELLAAVQQTSPDTVAALLTHPQFGAWAGRCLRHLTKGSAADAELGHLSAVAAAAAITAGHEFQAAVPMRTGVVMLPTLGCAHLDISPTAATVLVCYGRRGATVGAGAMAVEVPTDPRADGPGWHGLRRLANESGGLRLELDLDDLDPYRGGHRRPPAPRLDDAAIAYWKRVLDEAWALLVALDRDRAEAMTYGLRALVPLVAEPGSPSESCTSRDAFGAIMLTEPIDAPGLAETLVHEFQHGKLNALLDLVPLYEARDDELFYSPARDDPRPLGGLLHGAYAYAGVADFWRRYRTRVGGDRIDYAHLQFATWREQVSRASTVMLDSGRLTSSGARFVAGLASVAEQWSAEDTPAEQLAAAEEAADDHHLRWRINNLRPHREEVRTIAEAWRRGEPPPAVADLDSSVRPTPVNLRINPRQQLRYLRALAPERFGQACADPGAQAATDADIAYLRGDHETAVRRYLEHIAADPDNTEQWAGLALARARLGDDDTARALLSRPELVHAICTAVRENGGSAADPLRLAAWLAPCLTGTPATAGARGG